MVTVTNFARFNLSALPETERRNVTTVIETLNKDGSNALGGLNAQKASGYKDTYVIRTYRGTRIIAEMKEDHRILEVVDVYPGPVLEQPSTTTIPKVRVEKSRRGKVRSKNFASGSK